MVIYTTYDEDASLCSETACALEAVRRRVRTLVLQEAGVPERDTARGGLRRVCAEWVVYRECKLVPWNTPGHAVSWHARGSSVDGIVGR